MHLDERNVIPFILITAVFGVYMSTLAPVVYLGDSGELTAAAFSLGIPHNSGYPLYSMLGKLFCMIPIGNIGFRLNLMSVCFAVMTIGLVYSSILKITSSTVSAFFGALILAFTTVFWSQTISAEVYTLHTFFVALLIRILWWWSEKREFSLLVLFVFITGLSFGNHMQTVMLAPAVLFLIFSSDKKVLFNGKNFLLISVFFMLALTVYLYLPIRTNAGAAIHWGDPNNLERFLAHVTGRDHRHGYVLNKPPMEYLYRAKEMFLFVGSQFGVILLLALWGWIKLASARWRLFFVLVILFDFVYTIFLNFISLEITAFTLPTCVVLAILAGIGVYQALKACGSIKRVGEGTQRLIKAACCMVPAIPLFLNYGINDQSRNYTAYEHALNIFRTTGYRDVLFVYGDNNFFPVVYGRAAERMREDIILYDRLNIIYKMPYLGDTKGLYYGEWDNLRAILEKYIIDKTAPGGILYAVFDPTSISVPAGYGLVPQGMLHRVVKREELTNPYKLMNVWQYYSSESYYENFERDFLNRQVHAHFYLRQGQYLFMADQPEVGLLYFKKASSIGYDDTVIHANIAKFLTDQGLYEAACEELEKASSTSGDKSLAHNNWGVYHYKTGAYIKAINSFQEAILIKPGSFIYYKNLAHALYKSGREKEAARAFGQSLAINEDQPEIKEFTIEHGLKEIIEESVLEFSTTQ